MDLRRMHEQFNPEGIGRVIIIALGLPAGIRLRAPINPLKTTRSVKSSNYLNLLSGKRFTAVNFVVDIDFCFMQQPFVGF